MAKGDLNDICYRSVCNNTPANYYNHSTRMHYCKDCAMTLNSHNYSEAMGMYGHDLCTLVTDPIKEDKEADNLQRGLDMLNEINRPNENR